jgi:hypothetical protein
VLSADDNQFQLCRGPAQRQAVSEQMDEMSSPQARSIALADRMADKEWVIQ